MSGSRGVKTLETSITYFSLLSFPWKYPLSCAAFLRPANHEVAPPPHAGTLISAFAVLCGARNDLISERGVCCVFWLNVAAALIQLLTAVIMVGWIMSIFWGMDMVILASEYTSVYRGQLFVCVPCVCVCVCIISWLLLFPCWQASQAVVFWAQWDAFSCYQLTRLTLKQIRLVLGQNGRE